ncbi:hypothetical protein Z043_109432, partial [Scleropages formosus]
PPSPRSPHRANPTQKTKTNYCWSRFYWDCDQDVDNSSLDAKEQDDVTYVSPLFLTITNPRHFTLMTAWQENVDKVIESWFNEQDLDFASLYFGDPDSTGHRYGPDSPERREMVKQVDRTVGYIHRAAEKYSLTENLNIIMTANHGMSTVLKKGMVDEIILSKIPGFSFRDIAFHLLDYGPAGMLLPKEGMLNKVYNTLNAHPHLYVYRKEEIPGCFHYPCILPFVLSADPGYAIRDVSW